MKKRYFTANNKDKDGKSGQQVSATAHANRYTVISIKSHQYIPLNLGINMAYNYDCRYIANERISYEQYSCTVYFSS